MAPSPQHRAGPGAQEALYRVGRCGACSSVRDSRTYVELKVVAEVPEAVDDYSAAGRRLLHEQQRHGHTELERKLELDSLRYRRWVEATLEAMETPALVHPGAETTGAARC